jgi:hypothetical protein
VTGLVVNSEGGAFSSLGPVILITPAPGDAGVGELETGASTVLHTDATQGPAGPPGPAAVHTVPGIAVGALSGERMVKAVAGGFAYASADQIGDLGHVTGLTTGAAADGASVDVQVSGEIDAGYWTWTPGPVFLGLNGQLTQSPGSAAFIQQVGMALSATRLLIEIFTPIQTA